jgi:type III pantothenate kinase
MRNLAIDIGNTNSKFAVFDHGAILFHEVVSHIKEERLSQLISDYQIENAIVSNVNHSQDALVSFLQANTRYIPFSVEKNTGIQNNYKSPATLGLDRWAKLLAVHRLFAAQACLIIDMGTCITYDYLSAAGSYDGGSISLGIQMRFNALAQYTGKLPLIQWDKDEVIPAGTDTPTAIISGVLQGVKSELEGFINQRYKDNNTLKIMVTGGDSKFLLEQFKNSIFAAQITHDPYLVLKGLNEVIAFEYV